MFCLTKLISFGRFLSNGDMLKVSFSTTGDDNDVIVAITTSGDLVLFDLTELISFWQLPNGEHLLIKSESQHKTVMTTNRPANFRIPSPNKQDNNLCCSGLRDP
jgi:hypothetical protein